jgi:PPOX class probable F420-dependent enzyme
MPSLPVPPDVDEFLRQPNHAVLATLRPDGSPHTAVTWYLWEDGRVLLSMEDTRMRLRWLQRDGRIALSAIDPGEFYRHVSLFGRVVDLHEDPDRVDIDRLAVHYTGSPYANRSARRVTAWAEIDAWHGFLPDGYVVVGPQNAPGRWRV